MGDTEDDFAKVLPVQVDEGFQPFSVQAKTLIVFEADNLPVGQVWLETGELARIPEDVPARIERRRRSPSVQVPDWRLSVVICTRDRPDELRRCLASFPLQSRPPDEVIVVDNASVSPATREVALSAGATYIREDRAGLDFARNSGVLATSGDLVLFTDDDTELHPDWIANITAAFRDEEVTAVTGLVLPAVLKTEAQWVFETQWGFGRGFDRIDFGPEFYRATRDRGCPSWEIGAGANMAFRRSIFEEIGLFDERLGAGQSGCADDSEFWYRILAAGGTCRYEPTAVMYHHHRLTMDGLASQIYQYMRGHAAGLMVQHERTGDRGNLRRAFIDLPRYFCRCAVKRLTGKRATHDRYLAQQVRGTIAGLFFYWRSKRSTIDPASSSSVRLD